MTKKTLYFSILLVSFAALATNVTGQWLVDHILAPWIAEEVAVELAKDTFTKGRLSTPDDFRKHLLNRISKDRKDDENLKLYNTPVTYSHFRNMTRPLFVRDEHLKRAYDTYAYPYCRALKSGRENTLRAYPQARVPTLSQLANTVSKDLAVIETLIGFLKSGGERNFRSLHMDMRQGTFYQMLQHLRELEGYYLTIQQNHYADRARQGRQGADQAFEDSAKKLMELRVQAINTALQGSELDLKVIEGLPMLEQELVKHSYYVAGRRIYFLRQLGIIPTEVTPVQQTSLTPQLEMHELTRGLSGFVVRRCMDGTENGISCADMLIKWKGIIEKFKTLLNTDCAYPKVPVAPAAATTPATATTPAVKK